jgi:hypothetical protein
MSNNYIIDQGWYSITDDTKIEKLCEKVSEMEKKIDIIRSETDIKLNHLEKQVKELTNDNLRLVNRLLEAEISLERARNSLVRKNIPFPFIPTPLNVKFEHIEQQKQKDL